ncbi:hypothetical protein B0T17DRAFT_185852 [Bombardia bombarda]|uniref:Uncharacterized protein n=1 Tax=Bombardia bombarda TaxID=252184 RepID=A0AA40C8H2_9PEZI|nr:hypothetical protein B0T17DRAFT_185852 [Bombardia bombarda]
MAAVLPVALSVAAGVAGSAYLNARFSLEHDLLFLRITGSSIVNLRRAEKAGKLNAFYVLEKHALDRNMAGRPFILFEDKAYTYFESYQMVLRYGHWLKTRFGAKEGDIVAVDFQNADTFVFVWLGLWSIGARPAFINHHLTGAPLAHSLRASDARLALVDPHVADSLTEGQVHKELPDMEFVILTPELEAEAGQTDAVRYPDSVRVVDSQAGMAILIYTSGTTGLPKPAVVSWAKVYTGAMLSGKGTDTKTGEVFYICMPLYHSSASCLGLCNVLFNGATAAIGRKFSTKTFWADVRKYDVTIIQYVGETCRYLTVAAPEIDPVTGENLDKKHRVRVATGNGLRPDVWDEFKNRFGIDVSSCWLFQSCSSPWAVIVLHVNSHAQTLFELYAATEGALGTWNRSRNDFSKGAIGRYGLLSKAIVRYRSAVVRLDFETETPWRDPKTGFCQRVKDGEPGELLARLPSQDVVARFQGYYGNAAATNSKIMRDVFAKGDAWFRSGDVVRWDDGGMLYFSDRIGDTFRWKSENVSTAEVSQALGLHPAVQEANVYGVELPHHDGRAGCAAVVLNTPRVSPELQASLAGHVRKTLPRYALPLFLRVLKEVGMQNTGTNKQQKHNLRGHGVDPAKTQGDAVFWLRDGTYAPFGDKEWRELSHGSVKL